MILQSGSLVRAIVPPECRLPEYTDAVKGGECDQAAESVLSRPVRYRWAAFFGVLTLLALGHAHWETILGWWGR